MDYVQIQTFKFVKEIRAIIEQEAIRLLHLSCNPTQQDKECKYCGVTWDYDKATYCDCSENNIYDHHKFCRMGAGYDLKEDGSYDSDGFKSDAFERFENILEVLDNLPLRIIRFGNDFEQCEKVDDIEHFQHRRTKACAKCAITFTQT